MKIIGACVQGALAEVCVWVGGGGGRGVKVDGKEAGSSRGKLKGW